MIRQTSNEGQLQFNYLTAAELLAYRLSWTCHEGRDRKKTMRKWSQDHEKNIVLLTRRKRSDRNRCYEKKDTKAKKINISNE